MPSRAGFGGLRRCGLVTALLALLAAHTVAAEEYLGCYKDLFAAGDRDLLGSLFLGDAEHPVTPLFCEDYCGSRQFKYTGVQFGSECWCGNSYGKHGKIEEELCNTPCTGTASGLEPNRCGGALANSVYRVTKVFPKPPPHPNDGRPLLGLVMIVKDEAHTLPTTLAPLAPFIDVYYILDTGSKDGTQEAIRKVLGKDKGEIWEEPFIDYGRSRNRALEIAQNTKSLGGPPIFSLMLSADETVHNPGALRAFCETHRNAEGAMHEAYPIQMDVGWKFDSVRLSRTEKGWRYVGRVHEYLAAPDQKWRPTIRVPDAWIKFAVTDPERRGNREYKIRDILLDELKEKPTDTRATFYLARTYNVIRNHTEALRWFHRRIELGGWAEEVYESYYAIAFQHEALGAPWPTVLQAFLDAHAYAPERGEPLFNIAQHYYSSESTKVLAYPYASLCAQLPYPKDAVLWVQADVYNFQCLQYAGLTGHLLKHRQAWVDGYGFALRALKARPGEFGLPAAKAIYESRLTKEERLKAECAAGLAADMSQCEGHKAAACPPCTHDAAAGGGVGGLATSLLSKLSSEHVPEQSNFGGGGGNSLPSLHRPAAGSNNGLAASFRALDARSQSLLAVLGAMLLALCILAAWLLKRSPFGAWIALKVFGGKSSGGAGARGPKSV